MKHETHLNKVQSNPGLPKQTQHSTRRRLLSPDSWTGIEGKKLVKYYIWSIALYGAGTWTLRKLYQKHPERFEMWRWKRMEIIWTDRVRNEKVLQRVNEERNILHTIKRRKANWIGHILRRNCPRKHVIEGKVEERIEMTGRWWRRSKQLLDDVKVRVGYWKFIEEILDRIAWRISCGRGYRPVITQTTKWIDKYTKIHFLSHKNLVSFPLLSPVS